MKKMTTFRLLLACFLSILVSASAVPAHAAEREVYRSRFQGQSVFTDMSSYEDCVYSSLTVSASTGRTKADGRPTESSVVSGSLAQYNYCEGNYVYGYFYRELDDGALQIDRQLRTATLNTTVEVCNYECFPVTLQVTWTGTGDTTREKSHYQSTSSNYKSIYRFDGETRQSTISGSFTTPWGTSNLQYGYGAIQSLKTGSMTIYKLS